MIEAIEHRLFAEKYSTLPFSDVELELRT